MFWKKFVTLDPSLDSFSKAVKKNGRSWAIVFYGGFLFMEMIFYLIPLFILVTAYFFSDIPVIGPFLLVASRPWNLVFLALVGGGGFSLRYSLRLYPEGIMVRETVLEKTSRCLPGGRIHLFHPLSDLKGYFSGEHVIYSEGKGCIANAMVMDNCNFCWYVDMSFVFKANDITRMAGGPYERDIDMLRLDSLTMRDLSNFDLTKIEGMQIVKRISVDVRNQVGIFFKNISTEKVQSKETKKALAEELNKVARKHYQPVDQNDKFPDKEQPFLFTVRVKQILPVAKTQKDLGSIAKVKLMLEEGLISPKAAEEILKREALRGVGGVIISDDFGNKSTERKKGRR